MKILVTGAYGQLGNEISRVIQKCCCSIGKIDSIFQNANITRASSRELDISNLDNVSRYIKIIKPDLIINTAAYTDVDGCEKNPEKALLINSIGNRNLALAASNANAKLLCISTDYVFSGTSKVPYNEYDITCPINVYGQTKLLGEKYTQQFCNKSFIIRTSWLYGGSGNNFVKWVINTAKHSDSMKIVCDQRGTPTYAEDLVYHILKISQTEEYGIYHCSGKGECSRFEFAEKIITFLKIPCTLTAIKSSELNQAAKRPEYSSLNNMMLKCTIGNNMRHFNETLESFLRRD